MYSYLAAAVGAVLIGFSPILVRATDCDPLTTAFYRLLFSLPLAGLWALIPTKIESPRINPRIARALVLGGCFFAFDLGLWNIGLTYTSVVNATLFNNFAVFFIPLFCWILYRQRLRQSFLLAIICALLGSTLLIGKRMHLTPETLVGDALAVISAMSLACYYISIGNLRSLYSTGRIMFLTSLSCTTCLGIMAYLKGDTLVIPTLNDGVLLVIQAVFIHVGGQGLIAYSLGKVSATFTGLIMLLAPISAAIAAWIIFGELMNLFQISGMVIVLSSIALAKLGDRKEVVAAESKI